MFKFAKNSGFVGLLPIVGAAVIAAGLIGGTIYELNKNNLTIVGANKMLAQVSGVRASDITVISPNGGENFKKGDNILISWSGGKNKVQIGLVNDNGGILGWIIDNAMPNSGVEWDGVSVKDASGNIGFSVPSGNYKILAVSEDSTGGYCSGSCTGSSCYGCNFDYSDAVFNFDAGSDYQSVTTDLTAKAPISTISTGLSDLGNKVDVLKNGESEEKIDILFIPANVLDISSFKNTIEDILYKQTKIPIGYDQYGNITTYNILESFLNIEPFKTYKDKFNVSYVDKNINENIFNCSRDLPDPTKPPALRSLFLCNADKIKEAYKIFNPDYIVVAFNYPGFSSSGGEVMYLALGGEGMAWTFEHEFGHQFGGLPDLCDDPTNTRIDIMSGGATFDKENQDYLKSVLDCCYPRKDTVECNNFRDTLKNKIGLVNTSLVAAHNKIISCGLPVGVSTSTSSITQPTQSVKQSTSGFSSTQIQAIIGLLQAFGLDSSVVDNIRHILTSQ